MSMGGQPGWTAEAYWEAGAKAVLMDLDDAGYAVVPREPTEGMVEAGYDGYGEARRPTLVWKAMVKEFEREARDEI